MRMLLAEGRISRENLRRATLLQGRFGATLSFHLVQMGAISEQDLLVFFLYHFPVELYPEEKLTYVPASVISALSADLAGDLRVLPLARTGSRLLLGITDPSRTHVVEEVAFHANSYISPRLISESNMSWALGRYYGVRTSSGVRAVEEPQKRGDETRPLDLSHWHRRASTNRDIGEEYASAMTLQRPSSHSSLPAPVSSFAGLASDAARVSYLPVEMREPFAMDDLGRALGKARSRDEVVHASLELLANIGARTAFFTLMRSEIRGFAIRGPGTAGSSIKAFWIPSSARSTLADALIEQTIHLGPLGRTPADSVLAAALGGRPSRVLVLPVAIHGRVVGALYADHLGQEMPDMTSLARLAEATGNALRRILSGK
ncbi:MAG: hypothetical protein MUC50_02760 [Myxococcota bacterium]|nr:hypothetical protein [Myxococcota bacterium]